MNVMSTSLQKHLKTQALPADWDSKPVKVLTTENYEKITTDPELFVLVFFCLCRRLFFGVIV